MIARAIAVIALPATVSGAQEPGPPPHVQRPPTRQDSVMIRVVNLELRSAVQLLSQYLDRPIVFTGQSAAPVTLETPQPVARGDVVRLLRGLLDSQNFELVDDTASRIYRARQKDPPRPAGGTHGVPGEVAARPGGPIELFAIRLQHARAPDVATIINALYGRTTPAFEPAGRRVTLADELRATQMASQATGPPAPVPPGPPPPQAVAAGRTATLTGEITIVPDTRGNALLVRANRNDFALIQAAVKELDVRPLQVLIEVVIAEVRRDRGVNFGNTIAAPQGVVRGTQDVSVGGALNGVGVVGGAAGLGDMVLKLMGVGGMNVESALRTAASRGDVAILSRPVVLTANNQEAEIVVGTQRPFVQVARSLPTDAAIRDQVIQYKDVGTKLAVRPTVSADGIVQLDVTQEVSSATGETSFDAPIISTRSVKTELLVRDGHTVVLGGLADRQRDVTRMGVPLLSRVPLVGGVFGKESRRSIETELFIFLTPRVLRTDEDASRVSDPLRHRALRTKPDQP